MPADVYSLPVSTSLLNEVNAVGSPKRRKAQDGTVGDTAHEQRVSDHNRDETGNTGSSSDADGINEVHARDVDAGGPWLIKGGAERIVQLIVANVRARGYAKRRVKYVIFKGRIWVWRKVSGAWQFVQQVYTGADQHIEHFHVSFEYGSGSGSSNPENDTSPWGILAAYEQENDVLTEADKPLLFEVLKEFHERTNQGFATVMANGIGGTDHAYAVLRDTAGRTNVIKSHTTQILALVTELAGKDFVDEPALARAILAGLPPAVMGDAMLAALQALPAETARETVQQLAAALAEQ